MQTAVRYESSQVVYTHNFDPDDGDAEHAFSDSYSTAGELPRCVRISGIGTKRTHPADLAMSVVRG